MSISVTTKKSKIHGKGVFLQRKAKVGEIILNIDDSNVIFNETVLKKTERNWLDYLQKGKEVLMKEPERYINHSCDPNTYVKTIQGIRKVIAMRDIEKGEEITYDYAINGYGEGKWSCNCGSRNCRNVRYSSYFKLPLYLQRKCLIYLDKWFKKQYRNRISQLTLKRSDKIFGKRKPKQKYKRRPGVYGIIFNKQGKIAVVRRQQNLRNWVTYHLPGGGLNPDETHEACLKREVHEELGWDIEILDFIGEAHRYFYVFYKRRYYKGIGYFYKAKKVKQLNSKTEKGHSVIWLKPLIAIPKMLNENHAWAINETMYPAIQR